MTIDNWISVLDKKPENVHNVIMGGACCEVCYNIDIGFYEDGQWSMKNGDDVKWPVTHWMPIPEPPK